MAPAATDSSTSIRYAPEDASLPKPWRGLVDDKTGYVYYWNPETDITQYEKPVTPSYESSVPSHKSLSSSVQKSRYDDSNGYNGYVKDSNGGSLKTATGTASYKISRTRTDDPYTDPIVKSSARHGSFTPKGAEIGLSAESYSLEHEITVTGDQVPPPFTSFEATGFPPEILREVRCLLVKCRTLCRHPMGLPRTLIGGSILARRAF